jgi:hypothetical protein
LNVVGRRVKRGVPSDPAGGAAAIAAKAAGVIAIVTVGPNREQPLAVAIQGPGASPNVVGGRNSPRKILDLFGVGPKRHPANVADDAGDKSRFALRQGAKRSRGDRP